MSEHTNQSPPNDLIIAHMNTIQGLITRFAGNSAACKNMCLTLVAAILALLTANKEPQTLKIAYTVTLLMAWMDAYYLSMGRMAVELSKKSAEKIQQGAFPYSDLFNVGVDGRTFKVLGRSLAALTSPSVWPFYGILFACLLVVRWYFSSMPK